MISCYHLMIWAMDLVQFIEFFGVYRLWGWWMFKPTHDTTSDSVLEKDNLQYCFMNQTAYFLSLFFEFSYYIIMCIDLIITLKWPFISGKSRMPYYHLGVIIYSLLIYGLIYSDLVDYCDLNSNPETADNTAVQPRLFIAYYPILVTEVFPH
jgi:hypothetical protein